MTTRPSLLLPVRPFRQTPGYCGAASLKMVLDYFGTHKTERELARLTHSTRTLGAPPSSLVAVARKLGFHASVKTGASFTDLQSYLRRRIPVIVDWFNTDDGHYSVVVGLTRTHIILQDPELGRTRTLTQETFYRVWFDFTGPYLRSPKELHLRLIVVVYPERRT